MKTIYKYKLDITEKQVISLPRNYEILKINTLNDIPYLWALVDPTADEVNVTIYTYGTGDVISDNWNLIYLETYDITLDNYNLVFHTFILEE